jgi:O-antigen ligase
MLPLPVSIIASFSAEKAQWHEGSGVFMAGQYAPLSASSSASLAAFFKQWLYVSYFLLTLILVNTRKRLLVVVHAMVLASIFQVLYGAAAHYMGDNFPFWKPMWYGHDWVSGTFINKNHFAANISLSIGLGIGLFLYFVKKSTTPMRLGSFRRAMQSAFTFLFTPANLYLGVGLVLMAGLLLSQSRGALLAVVASFLFFFGYGARLRGRGSFESKLLLSFAILPILVVAWLGVGDVAARISHILEGDSSRIVVWKSSLVLFYQHWLVGIGNGAFQYVFTQVKPIALSANLYDFAHNDHLQLLVEQGLLGALLWFTPLVLCAIYMISAYRGAGEASSKASLLLGVMMACGAFFLHGFVDFNFHIPANALWFYALLAVGVNLARKLRSQRS